MQNLLEIMRKNRVCIATCLKNMTLISLPANASIEGSQKWLGTVSLHSDQTSTGINVYFLLLLTFFSSWCVFIGKILAAYTGWNIMLHT